MNVKSKGDTVRILRRIAKEAAQLPVLRALARPLHQHLFARQYFGGNSYCGVFPTFAEAKAQAHVLVNMTPMHPRRGYSTPQHIGIAVCPWRIQAVPEFVHAMQALGYTLVDQWASLERNVRLPFHPECDVERYHGFYFRRAAPDAAQT